LLEESFSRVFIEGELSRITYHNSGHIYFTLKDSSSAISCVMFRGNATKLKFELKEGLRVIVDGALTLYKPRGSYQINCFTIEPSGEGALALAYKQLKQKLEEKGYFNPEIKKILPKFPNKIAFITSATGAALQDMLRVAQSRYRAIEIDIYDVLVQGDSAANSIADMINIVDIKGYDILVIARGGGSVEDLWAFNEEIVADAIFDAKTPLVSAVGHEIDFVLSDFCADLRAPTPSAAIQMILPDTNELLLYLDGLSTQYTQLVDKKIVIKKQELLHTKDLLQQYSIEKKLVSYLEMIEYLKENFTQNIFFKINNAQTHLDNLKKMIESNHPKYKQKKGFVQLSSQNKLIDISSLHKDDIFEIMDDSMIIKAKVLQKEKII
jgi:exodeoxyribonuclease VII large subunit